MSISKILPNQSTISSSSIYLIFVNLIPIFGVAFLNWSLYEILLAYWLENIVIAFYAVLKIAWASGFASIPGQNSRLFKFFIIIFFIIHFGGFTFGHGVFIYSLFGTNAFNKNFAAEQIEFFPLLITFCLYMISHGISFWQNYIGHEEFRQVTPIEMMQAPYSRIIVMHLTVLGGAFAFTILGLNSLARIIIIAIKTGLDYKLHLQQHNKFNPQIPTL